MALSADFICFCVVVYDVLTGRVIGRYSEHVSA